MFSIIVVTQIPYFREGGEPQDILVSSSISLNAENGLSGNLVLPCNVSGTPTPTVFWFREGTQIEDEVVTDDGTLVLNVTEGVEASRDGTRYYCLAYNRVFLERTIFRSVLKSRDVTVRHTCELDCC